jgi:hypothetical protein
LRRHIDRSYPDDDQPEALAIVDPALDVAYAPVRRGGYAEPQPQFLPAD